MRSPFALFRKNQKVLMVVLIGLAMFAFIILDSLSNVTDLPPQLMVLVIAVLVASIFWVVGMQTGSGKQKEYALAGALLGAAIGFFVFRFFAPAAQIETTAGNLSSKKVAQMIKDRRTAVNFMNRIYTAVNPKPQVPDLSQFLNMQNVRIRTQILTMMLAPLNTWERNRSFAVFGNISDTITPEDIAEKYILLHEADRLGIQVSDAAIHDFINKVTGKRLSASAYLNIRESMNLSDLQLNDLLRSELRAQLAQKMLSPSLFFLPEDFWGTFRKLKIKQNLASARIPVSEFLKQVPDPSTAQLQKLFEKYKNRFPSLVLSPLPAFGIPERIQVAYFKADAEAIEKSFEKAAAGDFLSEKERLDELKEIDDAIAKTNKEIKDGTIKKGEEEKALADSRRKHLWYLLKSEGKINKLDFEVVKRYEETKRFDYIRSGWAPQHPGVSAKEKDDPFNKGELKPSPKPPKDNPETGAPAKKSKNSKSKPTSGTGSAAASRSSETEVGRLSPVSQVDDQFVVALQKQPTKTARPKAKKGSTAAVKPKTSNNKTSPAGQAAKKRVPASPARAKKPAWTLRPPIVKFNGPPAPDLPLDQPASPFKGLDDPLPFGLQKTPRSEIRKQILEERTREEIGKRFEKATKAMKVFGTLYARSVSDSNVKFNPVKVSDQLQKRQQEFGLKYVVTDTLPVNEFKKMESEDFGRLQSTNRRDDINSLLFQIDKSSQKSGKNLFKVLRVFSQPQFSFGRLQPSRQFVMWKIVHETVKVPKFDDDGVRENVEKAWRQIEARKFARTRAEKLAEEVKLKGLPIHMTLSGQTATGKKLGPKISLQITVTGSGRNTIAHPFSWISDMSAIPNHPSVGPMLSPIFELTRTKMGQLDTNFPTPGDLGDDFMKYIFDELEDGGVGVASNADESAYYVVQVFDRTHQSPQGKKSLFEEFAKLQRGGVRGQLIDLQRELQRKQRSKLFKEYGVRFLRTETNE